MDSSVKEQLMDYKKVLEQAVIYIEQHLNEALSVEEVSKVPVIPIIIESSVYCGIRRKYRKLY